MLGFLKRRTKPTTSWQWDVVGKHPAARDFFDLGPRSLMAKAFGEWIQRGAEGVVSTSKDLLVRTCSWRFWAKTPQKGILACGVIRNSCDSVGRPFPLLVMGTGRLESWEQNWELLPFACEGIWAQMEKLASRTYSSFELFQNDVNMLRPPQKNWRELELSMLGLGERSEARRAYDTQLFSFEQNKALFLPFTDNGQCDFFTMISDVHSRQKDRSTIVPNSLFMGGLVELPGLVLLQRPLSGQDFERMWMPGQK